MKSRGRLLGFERGICHGSGHPLRGYYWRCTFVGTKGPLVLPTFSATCIWFNKRKKSYRDKYVAKHNAGMVWIDFCFKVLSHPHFHIRLFFHGRQPEVTVSEWYIHSRNNTNGKQPLLTSVTSVWNTSTHAHWLQWRNSDFRSLISLATNGWPIYGHIWAHGLPIHGRSIYGLPICRFPYMAVPCMGNPYMGEPYMGDPYMGLPCMGDPYMGHPYMGDPYMAHPYMGDPCMGHPYMRGPYMGWVTHTWETHIWLTHIWVTHTWETHIWVTHIWETHIWVTHIWVTHIWVSHIWVSHVWVTHIWVTHTWEIYGSRLYGLYGAYMADPYMGRRCMGDPYIGHTYMGLYGSPIYGHIWVTPWVAHFTTLAADICSLTTTVPRPVCSRIFPPQSLCCHKHVTHLVAVCDLVVGFGDVFRATDGFFCAVSTVFDHLDLVTYEEVVKRTSFRRKTLVLLGKCWSSQLTEMRGSGARRQSAKYPRNFDTFFLEMKTKIKQVAQLIQENMQKEGTLFGF